MNGKPVSEAEAATGLGFADVHEFRRWQTEQGRRVWELDAKLSGAIGERDRFRWWGLRMRVVLEELVRAIDAGEPTPDGHRLAIIPDDLRLAIGVVTGKQADWGGKVEAWLKRQDSTL